MEETIKYINFAVGPVQMYSHIQKLGGAELPYFRTPSFNKMMNENEEMLKELVNAKKEDRAIFLTSSGSGAMEASVINLFNQNDVLLIIEGGTFGERFVNICQTHEIPFITIKVQHGEKLTAKMLDSVEGKHFTGILINLHETSTGTLYDMNLVSTFAKKHNAVLVVDAISAFISDKLDMSEMGADVVLIGGQKGLAIPPGIAPVLLSARAIMKIKEAKRTTFYFDFLKYLVSPVPFTPAISVLIQLHARLTDLVNGEFSKEQKRIQSRARLFRKKIKNYPFTLFSKSPSFCLTSLRVNTKASTGEQVINILRDRYHITLAASMGELKPIMFRIGHIGNLKKKDYDSLFAAFDDMITRGEL